MNRFRASFASELVKLGERRRASKKKRAVGTGAGVLTGAALGAPAGLLTALALMALKKKTYNIKPPKGFLNQIRYFRTGGLKRDIGHVGKKARRRAMIGGGIGAGAGALMGGLAGHEMSKQSAAIASRLTPQSSNVRGYSYDPKTQDLVVTFKNGGTYRYKQVPVTVARALARNKSAGKTIHRSVKLPGYEYEKVANGDMLDYFRKHPDKYREWKERHEAKKRRKKGTATERFVLSRTPGGLHKKAELEDYIVGRLISKRRQIAKLAGAAKKQVTWNGLTMKLEYLVGDTRSGVNGQTGEKWSRTMKDNYGYMPGTFGEGADGEAVDIYLAPEPVEGPVFRVKQKKHDGSYDEDKFMVGYGSAAAAKEAFLRNMPEWALGSMTGMSLKSFRKLVGQSEPTRVPSDGNTAREHAH